MRRQRLVWPSEVRAGKRLGYSALAALPDREKRAGQRGPTSYGPLTGRDEAIFLLHIAAEIEHSLMVQYLYAAYSLETDASASPPRGNVVEWQHAILDIAREEMGHLVTVQNLLRLIGGPLTFAREDYPFRSELYPFPFELEPLSQHSLAKYVVAEMPADPKEKDIKKIQRRAMEGNRGKAVNRVGMLYERIIQLFNDPQKLTDADFQADSISYQADFAAWGRNYTRGRRPDDTARRGQRAPELIIRPVGNRTAALAALRAVAEQGEGASMNAQPDPGAEISHFQRFLEIYRAFSLQKTPPVKSVPVNPVTMPAAPGESCECKAALITHPASLRLAQLFNTRYRMLLNLLMHVLHVEGSVQANGASNARGRLIVAAFGEMYHLRALADIITRQPLRAASSSPRCGPPFELPYMLALPNLDANRWRLHRDVLGSAKILINDLCEMPGVTEKGFLQAMAAEDRRFLSFIEEILSPSIHQIAAPSSSTHL
jgi:rubrerythrin